MFVKSREQRPRRVVRVELERALIVTDLVHAYGDAARFVAVRGQYN
jgi:hypothetical protein